MTMLVNDQRPNLYTSAFYSCVTYSLEACYFLRSFWLYGRIEIIPTLFWLAYNREVLLRSTKSVAHKQRGFFLSKVVGARFPWHLITMRRKAYQMCPVIFCNSFLATFPVLLHTFIHRVILFIWSDDNDKFLMRRDLHPLKIMYSCN